jgi:hypothetical protein
MNTAEAEIKKWVDLEAEAIKEMRKLGDVVETQASRQRELDATVIRNKAWQRARRRDAREKLMAASGMMDFDGDDGD